MDGASGQTEVSRPKDVCALYGGGGQVRRGGRSQSIGCTCSTVGVGGMEISYLMRPLRPADNTRPPTSFTSLRHTNNLFKI